MGPTPRVVFLPGACGDREFWRPVAERLPDQWEKLLLNWPGAGDQPHDPPVVGFDDLVVRAPQALDGHGNLVAQSAGGVVAVRLALEHPDEVRRLVLVATSGGTDVGGLGGSDWREEYRRAYPRAVGWISGEWPDHKWRSEPWPCQRCCCGAATTRSARSESGGGWLGSCPTPPCA